SSLMPGISMITTESIGLSAKHRAFHETSRLDRMFRNGFWTFTTERFFVIETAMARLGLESVFHLENDVMIYADVQTLTPRFERLYPGIAATFDNDTRCIP